MTTATATADRTEHRFERPPRAPQTAYLLEFKMPEGRLFRVARRVVGFMTPMRGAEEKATVIGLRMNGRLPQRDVRDWWLGTAPGNGKAPALP